MKKQNKTTISISRNWHERLTALAQSLDLTLAELTPLILSLGISQLTKAQNNE